MKYSIMGQNFFRCWLTLGILLTAILSSQAISQPVNPKERISFWKNNYNEASGMEADKAHSIFNQLVRTAGTRNGIEPQLLIIKNAPEHLPLPMAIPDGWIIISEHTLKFTKKHPGKSDDILAFILAHEIAHQLEDDFWHMKFFQTLAASKHNNNIQKKELQRIASENHKILSKELRADEQGLTFAIMAGFNPDNILGHSTNGSFFENWITRFSANPDLVSKTHPSAEQREIAVTSRMDEIRRQSLLFRLGVWFHQAGDYQQSIAAFEEFRQFYPGREVNHNLALSNHKLALQLRPHNSRNDYRVSLELDPYSRAFDRSNSTPDHEKYKTLLNKAIKYYQQAISQDKDYTLAYSNLACAYLENDQAYKAIGLLKEAITIDPENSNIHNNLAIAFQAVGDLKKSEQFLLSAIDLNHDNINAIFNLGLLAKQSSREDLAKDYWSQYLALDNHSHWANKVKKQLGITTYISRSHAPENINDVQVGHYIDEIPDSWKLINSFQFNLQGNIYTFSRFNNGINTISLEDEINYLIVDKSFSGITQTGLSVNSEDKLIYRNYGTPSSVQYSINGSNLIYADQGLAFQINNNKIRSWMLFRN
ncbi:MAG: hypothetical protein OQL06_05310 [Gammaproteobacteria bacterium]|nr:hypothetical protein [Gammaproteobacteria bacterium]